MRGQPELFDDLPPIPEAITGHPEDRTVVLHTDTDTGIDCLSSFGAALTCVVDAVRDAGGAAAVAGEAWVRTHPGPDGPVVVQIAGDVATFTNLGWTVLPPMQP